MITTVGLSNITITSHNYHFLVMLMRKFMIYYPSNFQVYRTVLLTIVTLDPQNIDLMLHLRSSEHTHLLTGSCCSVTKLCLTLCDPMDWSTPGFPVLHYLLTIWEWVCSNSCQLSWQCYLTISSSATPYSIAFNLFKYQGLFQWVTGNLYHLINVSTVLWPTVLDNHHFTCFYEFGFFRSQI